MLKPTHLTSRLPVLLVFSSLAASFPAALRADPPVVPAHAETSQSPAHSAFSEIMQTGAKLFGKGSRQNASARYPDVDVKGTSSSAARKEAIAALPVEKLSPENRQKVEAVVKSVSFYRRLPQLTFPVDPAVYQYFLAHPDAAVSIWRAMKISKLEMWQTGRYDYEADTKDGSVGALEVLHEATDKHIVVCEGLYKSPLLSKPIEAKSLLMLQASFSRDADGVIYVTHKADLFVSFPSQTVDVVSKIISPLTISMTDRTFSEVSLFLKMMSLAMARRPDWVEQIAGKMDGVADIRRDQVLELNAQVHLAAQKRWVEIMARREATHNASGESLGQVPPATEQRSGTTGAAPANREPASRESGEKSPTARVVTSDRR